jgi:predicted phage terminase large subunit-like protein
LTELVIDRHALEASILRDSLYDFVKAFWHVVSAEIPVWNWHIETICKYLQRGGKRVFKGLSCKHDILINVPPGSTKSTIASRMFPVWCWINMPSCQIISASHTFSLAADLSRESRDIINSDKFKKLFPHIKLKEDQNAKHHYVNEDGGMRYAAGIDGKFTGKHAHIIIIDDPLDPEQALSDANLALANRVCSKTLPTRKVSKSGSLTILIMQRLHQNDPSAVMLADAKKEEGTPVKHINLPGIIEEEAIKKTVRPFRLVRKYENNLLDPVRLARADLMKLRSPHKLGEHGFAGQILQLPVPLGGGMFKTDRIVIDTPPPLRHFVDLVRYWDKAGTEGGGAFTAGVKLGVDAKMRYWILDVVIGQWESAAREQVIKQTAQMDAGACGSPYSTKIGVEQEPGSGGKDSALATVKNLAGFIVRVDRPTGDKVIRADPFSVQVNSGNVYMVQASWNEKYIEELKHFPYSTYKDQVDASSGAFGMLTRPQMKSGGLW